jgi:hypothetical protein
MKVYFNHRAELCETIAKFGFTDDIFRSLEFSNIPGVELQEMVPDPNDGCLMPPKGGAVVMDIPEEVLRPFMVTLGATVHMALDGTVAKDDLRTAEQPDGPPTGEYIVPAAVANRYDRALLPFMLDAQGDGWWLDEEEET